MARRRVIALRYTDAPVIDEQNAAVDAITPGHLLMLVGGGLQKNTAGGAAVAPIFALEREELGRDIDEPYAIGDMVKAGYFHAGQFVYAFLASGENVAKGEYLTGDALGQLVGGGTDASDSIGVALDDTDNSAGDVPRVRVSIV